MQIFTKVVTNGRKETKKQAANDKSYFQYVAKTSNYVPDIF